MTMIMSKKHRLFALLLTLAGFSTNTLAENWQYRLPDKTFVANLSLPGTHDAATGSGFSGTLAAFGSRYAQTQEMTIAQQFELGIRVFDFRPAVYDDHMQIHHGIVATKLRFEDTMYQLRDLLEANPTEFVIIHLLHESDGDQVDNAYNQRIVDFLKSDAIKDYLVNFKKGLMVKDMRGKILVLSRDSYDTLPIGGFLKNWKVDNVNWNEQSQGYIIGRTDASKTPMCMQDYSDTHNSGGVQTKLDAIKTMLDYSTTHYAKTTSKITWYFNFLSAYSKVENLFGNTISLSDGYRDNASHTNKFVLDYLKEHEAGPMGIVMMDYAGVDKTGDYNTLGGELVKAIIENNFGYLDDIPLGLQSATDGKQESGQSYDLSGRPVQRSQNGLHIQKGKKFVKK